VSEVKRIEKSMTSFDRLGESSSSSSSINNKRSAYALRSRRARRRRGDDEKLLMTSLVTIPRIHVFDLPAFFAQATPRELQDAFKARKFAFDVDLLDFVAFSNDVAFESALQRIGAAREEVRQMIGLVINIKLAARMSSERFVQRMHALLQCYANTVDSVCIPEVAGWCVHLLMPASLYGLARADDEHDAVITEMIDAFNTAVYRSPSEDIYCASERDVEYRSACAAPFTALATGIRRGIPVTRRNAPMFVRTMNKLAQLIAAECE